MYSPNLRSFIRTSLRQEAEHYQGVLEPAVIAKRVVETIFVDFEYTKEDWMEAVYQLVYDEACQLFKKEKVEIPLQMDFLMQLGVPQKHAALILELKQVRLYVPSEGGYMDLVGDARMSRSQLQEAHDWLEKSTSELASKTLLVERLLKLHGYYE